MTILRIVEPGLLTQLQGTPYRGRRDIGVPLAGAADPLARAMANWLVGNPAEAPAIETAFAPIMLEAKAPVSVGIAGAGAESVLVDGKRVKPHRTLQLETGSYLRIEAPKAGCSTYIALAGGGISCPVLMDAQSTYVPGGFGGLGLLDADSDLEAVGDPLLPKPKKLPRELCLPASDSHLLRVVRGPEADESALTALTDRNGWRVSRRADRIGIGLEGLTLPGGTAGMISSPVFPGTIQGPPGGTPFLLGADAATMGGYARIAQLIRADRHLMGQLRPQAHVRFVTVDAEEARAIYTAKMHKLGRWLPDLVLD